MSKRTKIPFSHDASGLFLPWISMLMTFIAILTISGGLTAYRALSYWTQNVSASMTVQIPIVDEQGKSRTEQLEQDIETTLTILRTSPGIIGAKVLEDSQMAHLMEPWVNSDIDLATLPLPKIIDVTLDTQNPPSFSQIKDDLAAQVPIAILDAHQVWLDNLITMADSFMKLTLFILVLLLATTAFTVSYSAKTSLWVHKKVINLVHMMGANDWTIASQYAGRIFKLTITGCFFGCLLAFPILLGVSHFFKSLTHDFNCALTQQDMIALCLTPFIFAVLAFFTTLYTVLKALKRFI